MLRDYTNWPFLVIAPTSLLANWYNEIKKWAPDVLPVIYTGGKANRDMIRKYQIFPNAEVTLNPSAFRCHVLLTNYESIMSEGQIFKNVKWKVLVCDEGHRLKNDSAKTFGALERLNVEHKIILTGTPLQNNMKELFSLMKFLVWFTIIFFVINYRILQYLVIKVCGKKSLKSWMRLMLLSCIKS